MIRPSMILACGLALSVSVAFAGSAADDVSVSDPYARAMPPGQPNSAMFLELTNSAKVDHALVAAESSVSKVVELHAHIEEDGMMKMRRMERVDLPAGEAVSFQPGGLHLMLIGLERQIEPGQQVVLTLIYEDGSRTRVEAPVRKVGSEMGGQQKGQRCGSGRCGSGRCGSGK